jgi:hypothetical protein
MYFLSLYSCSSCIITIHTVYILILQHNNMIICTIFYTFVLFSRQIHTIIYSTTYIIYSKACKIIYMVSIVIDQHSTTKHDSKNSSISCNLLLSVRGGSPTIDRRDPARNSSPPSEVHLYQASAIRHCPNLSSKTAPQSALSD